MNKKNSLIIIAGVVIIAIIIAIIIAVVALMPNNNNSNDSSTVSEEKKFSMKYKGIEIIPGTEFDESLVNEETNISEIPSCAFDGVDKVYTYEDIEITVAEIEGKNIIYSVYFVDDTQQTTEEVRISDSKEDMIKKYGEEYEQAVENKYTYKKGNVELSFIIENETIIGIEYTLICD